jgi:hypothetical protein
VATKAELAAQLDEAGVAYPSDARKGELEALVADLPPADTPTEPEVIVPTPVVDTGRHPLPAEAAPPRRLTRAERLAAQPPVDPQLIARAEVRRRYNWAGETGVSFTYPPSELTRPRDTEEG